MTRETQPQVAKRTGMPKPLRIVLGVASALLICFVLLILGISIYSRTADFQRRAAAELVSVLQDATGGRVEVGHVSLDIWQLALEVDGLVIHGTEGPQEMPYVSVAKILVRLKINTFLSHMRGRGAQSHIGLNYLRVEEPRIHLIVDKDGKTNQPTPKHSQPQTEPIQDTLLDLQAGQVYLVNGLAVVNDRAIPFNLAANQLQAHVAYVASSDSYAATVDLSDLRTKMQSEPEVASQLHVSAELGRNRLAVQRLEFASGKSSHLSATGQLDGFANPSWNGALRGSLDLQQVGWLAGVQGLNGGIADLDVRGRSCVTAVAPKPAPKHFWQRLNRHAAPPKPVLPDSECTSQFLVNGSVKVHHADYRNDSVRFHDINATGLVRASGAELLLGTMVATLPGGGVVRGDMRMQGWLGSGGKSFITATVERVPLRSILDISAPEHFGDLGFDTAITGPVDVQFGGGDPNNVADTVQVKAKLALAPVGAARSGALNNTPITGTIDAHYDGKPETVSIASVHLQTPQTTLNATGLLGVNRGDPLTSLKVNLQARDLGEFDQLFHTLGLEANGKKGTAAIPVVLHGTLGFNGSAKGQISDLHVKGHVVADNLAVQLGTAADVHIDSLVADGEYSPNSGVAVASSTIKRNTAVLNLGGTFKPQRVVSRRGVVSYEWNDNLAVDANVKMANAQASDLLQIAGQQANVPVTGTIALDIHAKGDMHDLNGAGNVLLTNGVAYGEPYQRVALNVTAQGQEIDASQVQVTAQGLTVSGNGGYNLQTKHLRAQLSGNNLQLSKLDVFRKASPNADGVLSFSAAADGTVEQPGLKAQLSLANMVLQGKPIGALTATANSSGSNVMYQVHSTLAGAQVDAAGQTQITGDYATQAKLTLSGLDIANALALFAPGAMKGSSHIAGTVTVSGPLRRPQLMTGSLNFPMLDATLQDVTLKATEPLRASLRNGVVTLDQLHITGLDTDLQAHGSAAVFGDSDPKGGALNLQASGSVNMAIAQSFDKDLITSGKVGFNVAVGGRMQKPELTGSVTMQKVNLAISGIANGLSNLNGTLAFNEGRLDVKSLTATTGGGQLKIGGYLGYQNGIYGDLSATAETVRIRYYGLSSTANATLHLQGSPQSMLFSGNVLVTRFGVGPDTDFSAFASAGGVSLPADPNSLSNKIRLDVRLTSAPQLDFVNSYAKLAGSVDLTVHGTLASPTILGRIQITEGSATFAGTTYQLERGSVTFANPVRIDPVIDLDASAHVENYDVTIGLHGTTANLKPTYRSEPPLTEADIFNLLALGRTQEEQQLNQEQQTQAGANPTTDAILGGALNATVSSRVGKLFGAGSVKIDPSYVGTLGNSSARITVEEPISRQFTLVFATNVNETAQQLIQLQYRINENTSLVATRDENGVFSIVYKIRKRYK